MAHKSRRQLRAIKRREELAMARQAEAERIAANAARLRSMTSGFSRTPVLAGASVQGHILRQPTYRRETPHYPSGAMITKPATVQERLSPEMQAREDAAQREIEQRRGQVGVLFNKGGYQYISPGMDLTTLGKK